MIEIVKLGKGDYKLVVYLIEHFIANEEALPSRKHLQTLLEDDRTYIFVAILDDQPIGYILAYRFPSLYAEEYLAYLYDIEVLQAFRRKGAGRLLIESLLKQLEEDDVGELWLGTATDNRAGQALFSSTGACKSGETFNDFIYELP